MAILSSLVHTLVNLLKLGLVCYLLLIVHKIVARSDPTWTRLANYRRVYSVDIGVRHFAKLRRQLGFDVKSQSSRDTSKLCTNHPLEEIPTPPLPPTHGRDRFGCARWLGRERVDLK